MSTRTWFIAWTFAVVVAVPALALGEGESAVETEAPQEAVNRIVVEISNFQDDTGQLGCTIFSGKEGFPDDEKKADTQIFGKPKSKKGKCVFDGVKPGTYAIAVMHDADMSGELNTSFVGRPKEWWGVSKNAPAHRFGPPSFDECKFTYAGGKKTIKVKLQL